MRITGKELPKDVTGSLLSRWLLQANFLLFHAMGALVIGHLEILDVPQTPSVIVPSAPGVSITIRA
jgi:hypothetical protein